MKQSMIFISFLALGVSFFSCDKETPTASEQIPSSQDTLVRNLTPGILLCLEDVQDSYAVGSPVNVTIKTINLSDTSDFVIYTSSYPPYMWTVSTADSNALVAYPRIRFYEVYHDTLDIGDTASFSFNWKQTYVSADPDLDDNPIPAGRYRIKVTMMGNELFLPVFKCFTVE